MRQSQSKAQAAIVVSPFVAITKFRLRATASFLVWAATHGSSSSWRGDKVRTADDEHEANKAGPEITRKREEVLDSCLSWDIGVLLSFTGPDGSRFTYSALARKCPGGAFLQLFLHDERRRDILDNVKIVRRFISVATDIPFRIDPLPNTLSYTSSLSPPASTKIIMSERSSNSWKGAKRNRLKASHEELW